MTKLFYPLTGPELSKVISRDFTDLLAQHNLLAEHLTHSQTEFNITLSIKSYPMDHPEVASFSRNIGETQESAPDALRAELDMPQPEPQRQEDTGNHIDAPRKAATVTVGSGTRPRGRPRKSEVVTVSAPENTVGDAGEPIKVNSF